MAQFLRTVNGGIVEYLLFTVAIVALLGHCDVEAAEVAPLLPEGLDWKTLAIVGILAAPVAMFVTQLGKKLIKRYACKGDSDPFWYQWGLRLLSVAVGVGVGAALLSEAVEWGILAGACGGILSSVIVATLRKAIRQAVNGGGAVAKVLETNGTDDEGNGE